MDQPGHQSGNKPNLPPERRRSRRVAKVVKDMVVGGGWHWSFGWLRRPEKDCPYGFCYEEPDGDLIFTNRPDHKHIAYLDKWKDGETGDFYCAFSPVPTHRNLILHGRLKKPTKKAESP